MAEGAFGAADDMRPVPLDSNILEDLAALAVTKPISRRDTSREHALLCVRKARVFPAARRLERRSLLLEC